uniref:MT0083f n=1 Tax=Volvox carteri f. nagariensis TaxID=3068 RepID=D9CIW2_VOLCA|nr:MT0083f [Volvox carteri f. nagariensis]
MHPVSSNASGRSYNLRNRTCPDAEEETQVLVKSTQSATSIQWNIFRSQLAKLPKLDADKPAAMSARARCQSKLTDPEDGLRNVPNKQLLELEEMLLESNQEKEMAKQASACFPPAGELLSLTASTCAPAKWWRCRPEQSWPIHGKCSAGARVGGADKGHVWEKVR